MTGGTERQIRFAIDLKNGLVPHLERYVADQERLFHAALDKGEPHQAKEDRYRQADEALTLCRACDNAQFWISASGSSPRELIRRILMHENP